MFKDKQWKSPSRRRLLLCAGLTLLAICAVYSNSFANTFHFDDFHTVTDNPAVRHLSNLGRFFTDTRLFSILPANQTYRPMVSVSLALDYALGQGYVPLWFHLSTFAFFLMLVALLWAFFNGIYQRTDPEGSWPSSRNAALALVAAAWFGVHPVMAETVNYIIQRGDLYCTLGCVAALVLWARWPKGRRFELYLVPFALALLSKPPAAVFPFLLFAYVSFFEFHECDGRWRKSFVAAIPALAVTIAGLWLQSTMTPKSFAPSILDPWAYRRGQPFVWLRYFGQLFLPIHLNVDSDLSPFDSLDGRAALGILFALTLIAVIVWAARRRSGYPIAFGLIWFLLTQIPTSAYALSEMENDHRMFFSFPGLMLAAVWALWRLLQRVSTTDLLHKMRPVLAGVAMALLCSYAWGAHVRNRAWKTEESLWLDDVIKSPHNGRGLMIYGLTQMNKGDYPRALEYFTKALQYTPNYATLEINLGVVHGVMGHRAEAEAHFRRAMALTPKDDQVHAFYGRWLLGGGRTREALAEEQQAVALNPQRSMQRDLLLTILSRIGDEAALRQAANDTLAIIPENTAARTFLQQPHPTSSVDALNLSLSQYQQGQYAQSVESAQRALALDPKMAEAYNNIGAAYGAMGRWDDAVANEIRAVQLNPQLEIAKNNLAMFQRKQAAATAPPSVVADLINRSMTLNQAGKFAESIDTARRALKVDPNSALAWNNIAASYEAMHRWDDAIVAAKSAIALQPDFQLAKNNLAWSELQKKQGAL